MTKIKYILIIVCCASQVVFAQKGSERDSLFAAISKAKTPKNQVNAYFKLAGFYFEINPKKSDSLAILGLAIAEASRDRVMIVEAHLKDANRYLRVNNKESNIDAARTRAQKALAISRSEKNNELIIESENILARTYRISGDITKAILASNDAVLLLSEIRNDSLSVYTYNNLGFGLQSKNDMVEAFKAYLAALTIAEQSKNTVLLIACYETLIDFYVNLEDIEKAKDYAFKILAKNSEKKDKSIVMRNYFRIAYVYAAAKDINMANLYYDKAAHLADSLKDENYKIEVKLGVVNMYLNSNHFKEGYEIIHQSPEIFAFIKKLGMYYVLDKANGYFQMMLGNYDSSIYYYSRAEKFYQSNAPPSQKFDFYNQYAYLFRTMKQFDRAIALELKAKQAIESTGNIELLSSAVQNLDSLYLLKGDFTTAYKYHNQYQNLRDSLQKLSKEKDLQSLEIDNENKRKERETAQAEEGLRRRHNLQYMAITVAIGSIFILMVALGLFKVSTAVVKAMGFFAFIFLFEFVTLIADKQIHHFTHGEPWKILLIKIVLVAGLVPLHHWLEEKVIHYIMQRHGLIAEQLRKWKG